ncbi:MAG: hypothetical protein U0414_12675 [Polyangiaceae bacterium]
MAISGFLVGAGLVAATLFVGCSSTVLPPRTPSLCKDYMQMPCLSGRVCMEDADKGCEVCKCLGPPLPRDERWVAAGESSAEPEASAAPIGAASGAAIRAR